MTDLRTIFYVDDDYDDLEFFKDAVNLLNRPVKVFSLGEELLRQLHNPPPSPSIIFLDLNMPVKSGIDVLKEIRKYDEFKKLPIIVFSTTNNPDTIRKTKEMGADLFVTKPPTIQKIRKCVEGVLNIEWDSFVRDDKHFLFKY